MARKVGARRKKPKFNWISARRPVLFIDEKKWGMQTVYASSWALDEWGYHTYFDDPITKAQLYIVFHIRSGLPLAGAYLDEKSARIRVKRLETGIDTGTGIDLTPRNWTQTNDDVPF